MSVLVMQAQVGCATSEAKRYYQAASIYSTTVENIDRGIRVGAIGISGTQAAAIKEIDSLAFDSLELMKDALTDESIDFDDAEKTFEDRMAGLAEVQ